MNTTETDAPARAAIDSLQSGHLAALQVRQQIRDGGSGASLIAAAKAELEPDAVALAAFGRGLARSAP